MLLLELIGHFLVISYFCDPFSRILCPHLDRKPMNESIIVDNCAKPGLNKVPLVVTFADPCRKCVSAIAVGLYWSLFIVMEKSTGEIIRVDDLSTDAFRERYSGLLVFPVPSRPGCEFVVGYEFDCCRMKRLCKPDTSQCMRQGQR